MRSEEQEREAFEAWARSDGYRVERAPEPFVYDMGSTACVWKAWQASAAFARAPDAGDAEAAGEVPEPWTVLKTWDGEFPVYSADQLLAYGSHSARQAYDQAYAAMFDIKGDKVTRFDAQTAIRKLKESALSPTPSDNRQQYAKEGESAVKGVGPCNWPACAVHHPCTKECPRLAAPSHPPATPSSAPCRHEAYQGRCVHCDAPFVNGRATEPAVAVQAEPMDCDICHGDPERCDVHDCGDAHPKAAALQITEAECLAAELALEADHGLDPKPAAPATAEDAVSDAVSEAQRLVDSYVGVVRRHIRAEVPLLEKERAWLAAMDAIKAVGALALRSGASAQPAGGGTDLIRAAMEKADFTYQPTKFAQALIDEMCDRIKAADEEASKADYMLDSDDCISVLRGTWTAKEQPHDR